MGSSTATTTEPSMTIHSSPSSIHLPSESSTSATLRSLYPRAAKSFLHRDFALTHALLASAFDLLTSPPGLAEDTYGVHRRKWDLLRITLETTAYASPPESTADLPAALRANALHSPSALLAALHARSLRLFTPAPRTPSAAHLPAQILVTLVLSALKLDSPHTARAMIEEWLACRRPLDNGGAAAQPEDAEGYEKALEIYCVHVLPRLEEWEYAKEFLSYERELPNDRREHLITAVEATHERTLISRRTAAVSLGDVSLPKSALKGADLSPSRAPSPSPSTSSAASSASSNSTHTARPPARRTGSLQPLSSLPKSSPKGSAATNGHAPATSSAGTHSTPASTGATVSSSPPTKALPTPPRAPPLAARPVHRPTALHVLTSTARAQLAALLAPPRRAPLAAVLAALLALLPLAAFLARLRAARASARPAVGGSARAVRRRLVGRGDAGAGGVWGAVWGDALRVVGDTVRMAGRGLV